MTRDNTAPHPYLVEACRRAGAAVRELHWAEEFEGERPIGRFVELGRPDGQEAPDELKLVGPRLLTRFARAAEDVAIFYELGLVGLYAGLSKLVRRRALISLVEGDYRHLGRTGTAGAKVALRRLAARSVDVFMANNPLGEEYLVETLKVPRSRIVTGWWLAGMPTDLPARVPAGVTPVPEGAPLFVCAGRLIPAKGIDLLIEAVAVYRREFGPCMLWVIGDGPEREHLGRARPQPPGRGLRCLPRDGGPRRPQGRPPGVRGVRVPDAPGLDRTRRGRGIDNGMPVVVSPMSGAAGTIVRDGVNGFVVDPRDVGSSPERWRALSSRRPAWRCAQARVAAAPCLRPSLPALILRSVALVRDRRATPAGIPFVRLRVRPFE